MKYHENICCEATFCGLEQWYVAEFEKLGWMILAKSRGLNDKIREYKMAVKRLCDSIEHKLIHIHDNDKKEDLLIMHHNVRILMHHIEKDFS